MVKWRIESETTGEDKRQKDTKGEQVKQHETFGDRFEENRRSLKRTGK